MVSPSDNTQAGSSRGASETAYTAAELTVGDISDEAIADIQRRVQRKETYLKLLRRIQKLDKEVASLSPRSVEPSRSKLKGSRFNKHSLEYCGKNIQELRQWISTLEDDHANFPDVFDADQRRAYYASRALKTGTQAYKHWMANRDKVDLTTMTRKEFQDILHDALGSKEARDARAYYENQEAKWGLKKHTIVEYIRYLKSLEETFLGPVDEHYLYYQLWRQIPEETRDMLIGTNKPKTRDEIIKAIEQLRLVWFGEGAPALRITNFSLSQSHGGIITEHPSIAGTTPRPHYLLKTI
jgi:hypothetical protein